MWILMLALSSAWAQCPEGYGVYKCYLSREGGTCAHGDGCGFTYRTFQESIPPGATITRVDLDASGNHALIQYCRQDSAGKRP
jgi:hypothetical protein